jgi:hypothetical protein
MVTVPAENKLDQLTSYVRVSPGWNAWIPTGGGTSVCWVPDGGGAIVCSAVRDAEAASKSPGTRKQNTTDVRKNRLDPIFTGRVI